MKRFIKFIKNNIFIILALLYLIWPIDIIPDVFAAAGGPFVLLDDGGMILFAITQKLYSIWKNRNKTEIDVQQPTEDIETETTQPTNQLNN